MSAIELFRYEAAEIRVVMVDGEPWFVLADLCKALGLTRSAAQVSERLDDGVRQPYPISDSLGRTQNATVVSEAGMYEVVIRSDKPEAVTFRRWITGEVLPQIRKTGSYGAPTIDGNAITRLELIQIAHNAETERLALEAENKVLAPKAEAYDSFLDATGKYGVGAVAKMLGKSQNWLFRELRNRDVFIAKGNVEQMPSNAMEDPNNLLMHQADGTFREASIEAGVASLARSRGAVLADLNLDGRLDLAVVNRRVPMEVYANATETEGHWLAVDLRQPGPNTRAVGAWLDLRVGDRVIVREVTVGGTHASGVALPEHFGLGPAEAAELRVTWPDGTATDWLPVETDCTVRITRGTGGVTQERL